MLNQLHFGECDSTQDELERHMEGSAPSENLLISTNRQVKGRGRGAHSWDHLTGALAFSFSASPHPALTWQSLEVAVCVAEFLDLEFGAQVQLKWPNDVYADGKKCGGILLKHRGSVMLIGIGLNLLPAEQWGHALADARPLAAEWQRELPAKFVRQYLARHPMPVDEIRSRWLERCVHLNEEVTITDGDTVVGGRFVRPGEHGEAILLTSTGEVSVFNGSLRWS